MNVPFVDLKSQYHQLKESIDSRIHKVLDHGAYINGPEVIECENRLKSFVGTQYALTCASGTDALLMPMMALGIKPGDEVITTAFSFIATAETIVLAGATPVYVDIDPKTYNLDLDQVEKAITPKTKAIAPVSLYGQMCDMDRLGEIAAKHNLWVLEDAAQSFGALFKGRRSCSFHTVGGTSFFPAKPLGCYGDGGAVFTNDEKLFIAMKEIREHGSEQRYYHTRLGINGRLDTIQCAIILAKMDRYQWELDQRDRLARNYSESFQSIKSPDFSTPYVAPGHTSVWAQYTLTVQDRASFQKKLSDAGVPTSVHYPRIMPEQPWYAKHGGRCFNDLKNAKWAASHVVSLPMYPDMDDKTQNYIIDQVRKALNS